MILRSSVAPCESVNSEPSVIEAGNQPLTACIARRSSPYGSLASATRAEHHRWPGRRLVWQSMPECPA